MNNILLFNVQNICYLMTEFHIYRWFEIEKKNFIIILDKKNQSELRVEI